MGILTGIFVLMLGLAIFNLVLILRKDYKDLNETRRRLAYIKSIGLFGLVTGIFGQMIGLYAAFQAIEAATDVSPAIMAGGLKVSMITPIYGVVIFLVSYLLWLLIDFTASKQAK